MFTIFNTNILILPFGEKISSFDFIQKFLVLERAILFLKNNMIKEEKIFIIAKSIGSERPGIVKLLKETF